MDLFALSGLINAIASTSFGVLVMVKNWKSKVNRLYFLMTFSLAVWSIYYWAWLSSDSHDVALLNVQLLSVGSLFIPLFFFHWISTYLNQEKKHKYLLIFAYILAISILFFYKSPLFIADVSPKLFFNFWPTAGIIYTVYVSIIYIGLVLYSWYLLFKAYKDINYSDKRGQILYLIIGSIIGFGGGFTNFPLWFGIPIPPYGNFLVMIFPFTFFYSMYKYKLFNTRTITTEISVFLLIEILLVKTILSTTISEFILQLIIFVLVTFFGVLIVRSVYKEVEQREKIETLAKDLEKTNAKLGDVNHSLEKVNTDLNNANTRLKELDQLKSEFVSLATHQIRGPLTAIKGYTSMIIEGDYGKISAPVKEAVSTILQSSNSLVLMVGDFLDVSRIEQGRMKYDFKVFDLKELVSSVIKDLKPNIERNGLKLDFEVDESKEYFVDADSVKIRQVIANIIDNAVKYTQKGNIKVKIETVKDLAGEKIRFTSKDTGVGIPKTLLPKLFEKFSRGENANEVNIIGTGLGLYLAREIIKAHGGKIWAESEGHNKGSTFAFELSVVRD